LFGKPFLTLPGTATFGAFAGRGKAIRTLRNCLPPP
jgi:hypothetical protein